MMAHVILGIMERLAQGLQTYCVTQEPDERARPSVIAIGLYQGDPSIDKVVLQIVENDGRDGERWAHQIDRDRLLIGLRTPWKRRFTIRVLCNFADAGYSQDLARQLAHRVLSNVETAVHRTSMAGITGDGGEVVVDSYLPLVASTMRERGGVEGELIWEGTIYCEYMTETR